MTSEPGSTAASDAARTDVEEVPTWAAVTAAVGAAGVVVYVGSWVAAGFLTPEYDPFQQAISELFAHGAPALPRWLVTGSLGLTGVLLTVAGPALDRGLPGEGRLGPVLTTLSGIGTVGVAVFPCSDGCPGFGTSLTDTMHTVTAGVSYGALITAPVAFGRRLRGHDDRFAAVSTLLGGLAIAGFVVRYGGLAGPYGGLQQRVMNTLADAWYVLAGVAVVRRWRRARRD